MTGQSHRGSGSKGSPGGRPLRTCVGCRRVLSQVTLLRITRTPEGFVEPDVGRRGGGRGAYLCLREECLTETLRRGRLAQVFRAPAAVKPGTIERLRNLIAQKAHAAAQRVEGNQGGTGAARREADRRAIHQDVGFMGRPGESVEGGW